MSSIAAKASSALITLKGTDNYFKWASTMKAYFMVQGFWNIINGKETKPTLVQIPAVPAQFAATNKDVVIQMQKPVSDNQDKINKWEEDDMQANGILILYVDLEIHEKYQKELSNATWEAIKTQYGTPSSIAIRTLMHEMNLYTVVDNVRNNKDFPAQLTELNGIISRLVQAGHKIEEEQRVITITEALTPKWKNMVDAAMLSGIFKDADTTIRHLTGHYNSTSDREISL